MTDQTNAPAPSPQPPNQPPQDGVNTARLFVVLAVVAVFGLITVFIFWLLVAGGPSAVSERSAPPPASSAAANTPPGTLPASITVDPDRLSAMQVPSFEGFVNQQGDPIDRAHFQDQWTVLAFVFTRCPLVCPTTMGHMFQMNEQLENAPIRYAFLTVDPVHDTPDVMQGYIARQNYHSAREPMAFIPPDPAAVRAALEQEFKLAAEVDVDLLAAGDQDSLAAVVHPTRLLLIGPDVTVRAIGSSQETASALALAGHAAELAQQ